MVTYGTFTIVDISDGAQWYSGTLITNTSTTPTIFPNSGVLYAVEGDMYLNTSTQNTYRCVEDGDASHAKWVYVNNIKGLKGDTGRGISSIKNQYYLHTSSSGTLPSGITWSDSVPPYETGKYYWTRTHIVWDDNNISDTNPVYDGALTTANSTAQNALTTANSAAYEEQYIYISKPALTVSVNGTTTWVTAETQVVDGETVDYQNTWTRKRPTYDTNYPVLFIAKQRKAVDGTITCTTPIKDDTTTVIDGGHIITGTLDASAIGTGYLRADRIEANSLSIGKINGLATELDNASKTADSYIANFNSGEVSGAFIHKSGSPSTPSDPYANGVLITDDIDIIRSGTSVANYGNVARIGKLNTGRLEITNADITAYGRTGGVAIKFGSKNNTLDGVAEVTERLIVEDLEDDNNIMTGVWLSYIPTYIRSCYIDDGSDPMTSVQVSLNGHIAYNNTDLVIGSFVIITYSTFDLIPYLQIGENAHADGGFSIASDTSTASGNGSIAIGMYNKSVGDRSASFGRSNKAYGECSFACGSSNSSSGISSFSAGNSNEASGNYSSAIGVQNISAGEYQTVIGKYNIKDNNNEYVFIIGNGSTTSRSNALVVDWNGNIDSAGVLTQNGNSIFAYEDVTVSITYTAGNIGTRGATVSLGSTQKTGYTYSGAVIIDHRNTAAFNATITGNAPNNTAHLVAYRATGNAVSDASVTVRKTWVLDGYVTT